ncbi:MAG: hypothetical protein ABW116_16770 [Candidatus Sedimenticola sp. 20ELBAFRAG]
MQRNNQNRAVSEGDSGGGTRLSTAQMLHMLNQTRITMTGELTSHYDQRRQESEQQMNDLRAELAGVAASVERKNTPAGIKVAMVLLLGFNVALAGWLYINNNEASDERWALRSQISQLESRLLRVAERGRFSLISQPAGLGEGEVHRQVKLSDLPSATTEFGFNQSPFSESIIPWLEDYIQRLEQQGFRGLVKLETTLGHFCVIKDRAGQYRLPSNETPVDDCLLLADEAVEADKLGIDQTLGFRNFIDSFNGEPGQAIRVELATRGFAPSMMSYPDPDDGPKAGPWNEAALKQQVITATAVAVKSDG